MDDSPLRIRDMRILLTIIAILIMFQSYSQNRRGVDPSAKKINIGKLVDNGSITIASDSLYDITSISYAKSKDVTAVAYKLGDEADSIHIQYITSSKRVFHQVIPLYSSDARATFIQDKSKLSSGKVILMTYNEPFKTITSYSKAQNWSYNSNLAAYAGSEIDGYITNSSTLKPSVYFSDAKGIYLPGDTLHSVIYQMEADELGYSWKTPRVVVKHNSQSVSQPSVAVSKKSRYKNVMMMQGSDNIPMISFSRGDDNQWSHPIAMSSILEGICTSYISIRRWL